MDNVSIEAGLRDDLYDKNSLIKDHFDVKEFEFEEKIDGEITMVSKPLVFCKNVDNFVQFVKVKRNVKNKVSLKYGADGGGNLSNMK